MKSELSNYVTRTRRNEFGSMTARKGNAKPLKTIKRPYKTIKRPQKTLKGHERPYKTTIGRSRTCSVLQGHARSYMATNGQENINQ